MREAAVGGGVEPPLRGERHGSSDGRLRLIGVADGDGLDPHTASGTARPLFDALARRHQLERADVSLGPWQRRAVLAASVHPRRPTWRQRFWNSPVAFEFKSGNSRRLLAAHDGGFDLAVQVYGLFQTKGSPYVVYIDTTHDLAYRNWPAWSPYNPLERRVWFARERRLYQRAEHIFPASTPVRDSLISAYGISPERITVALAGSNFFPLPELKPRRREPVILFVGKQWERKGGPTLIEAFRAVRERVPDARLLIVGTTEAPAGEPGTEVLGKIMDRNRMAELLAGAAVFTVPSLFCPFTNSLMEAMTYGLPCVSTTTMGVPELVLHGETGLLCEPGDPVALADALVRLLTEPELADRMGAAGRRRVERELTWDRVAERMAPGLDRVRAGLQPAA